MAWSEPHGGAGTDPNHHRQPDANEVEHDLDPADMADAYLELVDQGYVHADVLEADDWSEPDYVKQRRRYRSRDSA